MARRIARVVSTLVVAAGLLFGALLVLPAALGWQRYVIVSGSMTGTYDRGSLVLDEVVPVGELREGDVITYRPPSGSGPVGLVTHRIAEITTDKLGQRTFRTKGDANEAADPWTFHLPKGEQARVRVGVPYVGFALAALGKRDLRMLIVGLPAGLIAFFSIAGLWREAGAEPAAVPR
jgi:signal peptidase I